jgi:hypothetical protein
MIPPGLMRTLDTASSGYLVIVGSDAVELPLHPTSNEERSGT